MTSTGRGLSEGCALPSWPLRPAPQQKAAPPCVSPQVCASPAASAENVSESSTGAGRWLCCGACAPRPSCPLVLEPQHQAAPAAVKPQLWLVPNATDLNATVAWTATGASAS